MRGYSVGITKRMNEWKKVSFASDINEDEECGEDYTDCPCPGPTQDGIEYKEIDGVLYGRIKTN